MKATESHPDMAHVQSTWLITFADLITLLLCAFLLFFSVTWNRKGGGTQGTGATNSGSQDGILLADDNLSRDPPRAAKQSITVLLTEADYEVDGVGVVEAGWNNLKNKVIPEGYEVTALELASCSPAEALQAWEVTEQRAMGLVRQLIDAGVRRDVFRLQIAGPFCESMRAEDDTETVTAIRAELELKHG